MGQSGDKHETRVLSVSPLKTLIMLSVNGPPLHLLPLRLPLARELQTEVQSSPALGLLSPAFDTLSKVLCVLSQSSLLINPTPPTHMGQDEGARDLPRNTEKSGGGKGGWFAGRATMVGQGGRGDKDCRYFAARESSHFFLVCGNRETLQNLGKQSLQNGPERGQRHFFWQKKGGD